MDCGKESRDRDTDSRDEISLWSGWIYAFRSQRNTEIRKRLKGF